MFNYSFPNHVGSLHVNVYLIIDHFHLGLFRTEVKQITEKLNRLLKNANCTMYKCD